jgi:hypothetical protein
MISGKLLSRAGWFVGGFVTALSLTSAACRYPPSFGEARFNAIRQDMTRQEVVELLGCPPGDYRPAICRHPDWYTSTSDVMASLVKKVGQPESEIEASELEDTKQWVAHVRATGEIRMASRIERLEWWGKSAGIKVIFGKDGRMIHRSLWSVCPPRAPRNPARYAQWWLGW